MVQIAIIHMTSSQEFASKEAPSQLLKGTLLSIARNLPQKRPLPDY